ncbi:MAG: DNA internalization-related competence protein ComEC/Rec2, partial [Candidatus Eremiobacteraeota bacterium]|nr:DNA internalization-related competence protein ComEC/Rec2 [Candidatus Eremiobacteraeota bacterium]
VVLNSAASAVHLFQTTLQLDDGRTLLATFAQAPPPAGTTISVRGRVEPFDAPRNAGEPDERAIERERGFDGVLADAVILRTLASQRASPKIWLARLQAAAGERLRRTISEPYASVLAGELWGEKSALPATVRQEFQDSGTVHMLVTAGLHLAVVAWLSMLFTARLEMPRQAACALTAAVVWSYALFSGLHLPAMRAATMITFALIARACGAKALSWNALAAAAVFALLHDPQSIQSVSFWMSFSCVSAIFLTAPLIKALVEKVEALPPVVAEAFTLSAATQIGIWPLTAVTFLLFAPYSVVANAAVVPLVGATMLMGTAQIIFADVTPLANAVASINSFALQFVLAVIQSVAALPFAHVVMTPPALWAIGVYDGALCTAVWLLRRNARTAAAAIAIVAGLLVLSPPRHADARLKITLLDVGQADAIVIQTPRGHAVLVDAGGRLERGPQTAADSQAEHIGETIVTPFLIRAGVHRLDAIVLSHPHGDHAGGVAPVMRLLHTDRFADSGQRYGGYAYNDALAVAHEQQIPVVRPASGSVWRTDDGISLTFLGPTLPLIAGSRNDINNNSIVFMLEYKSFRMLFTGDAGAEAEERILNEGRDLHADVLKVGHHGSAYSSIRQFIAAVHPRYAIISVGRHNMFGHPAPSTLETLERYGAQVYRTDQDGAVTIRSDGRQVDITSMLAP